MIFYFPAGQSCWDGLSHLHRDLAEALFEIQGPQTSLEDTGQISEVIWNVGPKTAPDVPIHHSLYYFYTKVIETMNIYLGWLQISCLFCITMSSGYTMRIQIEEQQSNIVKKQSSKPHPDMSHKEELSPFIIL